MFSSSDLIVNSIWPWVLILVSCASVILESFLQDKKFISPWLSVSICVLCTIVLIFLGASLADLLIFIMATLTVRLIMTLVKGEKKNDV